MCFFVLLVRLVVAFFFFVWRSGCGRGRVVGLVVVVWLIVGLLDIRSHIVVVVAVVAIVVVVVCVLVLVIVLIFVLAVALVLDVVLVVGWS